MFVHDDFPGHVTSKVVSFLKLETPFTAVSVDSISWGKTFSRLNCVSTACARTCKRKWISISWVQICFPQKSQRMDKMNTGNYSSTETISFSAEICTKQAYRRYSFTLTPYQELKLQQNYNSIQKSKIKAIETYR